MALSASLSNSRRARGRSSTCRAPSRIRDRAAFEAAYGHKPPSAEQLATSVYGLPELSRAGHRRHPARRQSRLLPDGRGARARPAPSRRRHLAGAISIVDAMSGVTGAGRRADEAYSFAEVYGDARAYKVLNPPAHPGDRADACRLRRPHPRRDRSHLHRAPHPHRPRDPLDVVCAPSAHREDERRAHRASPPGLRRRALRSRAGIDPEQVNLHQVQGTNLCTVGVRCDPKDGGRVVVVSALDNLLQRRGRSGRAEHEPRPRTPTNAPVLTDLSRSSS